MATQSSVCSVAFSTDGTHIVSGSYDNSVRVWDVSTGKELNVLNGHTELVNSVAFSTDGTHIVSGSSDISVRVWDMQPHYIREQTKSPLMSPTYTGWLLSTNRQAYLMFVPLDALLSDSFNILTIPHSAASYVDFTNATIGSQWHDCYTP
jgi:WD40 repeat protein